MQLAEFVATQGNQVVRQVARSHALGDFQGLVQRDDDLAGDCPGGQQTERYGQCGGDQQQVFGTCGIGVTYDGLRFSQFLADGDQNVTLSRHVDQCCSVFYLRITELSHGCTVSLERLGGLLQVGDMLIWDAGRQAFEVFQGIVDRGQGWLLGIGLTAVGVTAHLISRLLQQLAQFDHRVVLRDAVALQQRALDRADLGYGIVGIGAQLAACVFTLHGGLRHFTEGTLVFGHGSQLLIDHRHIGRLLNHAACRLQAAFEFAQEFVDRARSLLAATHVVIHARQAQVLGQLIEAGDKTQLVTTADDAAHAGPAGEGDQQCQQQHQAETDSQLAFDADVSKTLG
ncbi:hypothetical protein D3C72_970190 [compost metagenome]